MSTDVTVALITGAGGLVAGLFGVVQSKIATRDAVAAKEAGQRQEQLRVKATEAGERLLDAIGGVLISAQTLETELELGVSDGQQLLQNFVGMGRQVAEAFRVVEGGARMYLTPDLYERVVQSLHPFMKPEPNTPLTLDVWRPLVERLDRDFAAVAWEFRQTYLEPS
jgi:hypothetical protein